MLLQLEIILFILTHVPPWRYPLGFLPLGIRFLVLCSLPIFCIECWLVFLVHILGIVMICGNLVVPLWGWGVGGH